MVKVSVIVPVYRVEKYLPKLIESILSQTLSDLELILVDDGSPDDSGKICDAYAEKDPRIKVIHKENGGICAARNDGLSIAVGEWVLFCDSDDWVERDALIKMVEAGDKSEADIVFADVNLVENDNVKLAVFYDKPFVTSDRDIIDKLIMADFCKTYCFDPPADGPAFGYGGPWNKIIRRRLLVDNGIKFDVRLKVFEDIIFTAYIFAAAQKIQYIHTVVYNYRQLGTSSTHQYKNDLPKINKAIFAAWCEFMSGYDSEEKFAKPYYANVIRRFKSLFDFYFFHPQNETPIRQQLKELKQILHTEPYLTAIREADFEKLQDKTTKILWLIAKMGAPLPIWIAMQLYHMLKG